MSPFQPFERVVLRKLLAPHLAAVHVERLLASATLISYEPSRAGYYLTTHHARVPADGLRVAGLPSSARRVA